VTDGDAPGLEAVREARPDGQDPVGTRTLEGVRVLTLQRPAAKNALDRASFLRLTEELTSAADDPMVHVVVLTGAGDAFCAGADTRQMSERGASDPDAGRPFHAFVDALDVFPKPLLAAVNGVAVGLGTTMLAYCDVVIVGHTARLRAPFVRMGLVPEAGSSALFPARLGWQHTARLFFTGAWISAEEAVEAGLALAVVPASDLLDETLALARQMAEAPLAALVETKRLLLASRPDARAARARESEVFRRLLAARNA
jgi:enoyl-CoA hydratase/carnithine racemase